MQTILGAGGAIGRELAKSLTAYTRDIRLVARNPKKVNDTDTLFVADLTDPAAIDKAVEGSEVVYLTAGFEYNIKVWRATWPSVMRATIDACAKHGAKLVFFDNVYMYPKSSVTHLTEEVPMQPETEKGKVRAEIAQMLLDAVKSGRITALIARSADFYGPGIANSMLQETITKNLAAGKAANYIGSLDKKHSYTYTPDAGRATALLGNTPDAYNQVWHLPTHPDALTAQQWIDLFAGLYGKPAKKSKLPTWLIRILGIFVPFMRELPEMMYQYEQDYHFDSSKFSKRFPNFRVTSYPEGAKEIVNHKG